MTSRPTKPLTGAAKDRYIARVLAEANVPEAAAGQVRDTLRREVTQVRVRAGEAAASTSADGAMPAPVACHATPAVEMATAEAKPVRRQRGKPVATPFDPYTPNVIVVLRTAGREAVLAALGAIARPDDLKLLAREQQLNIAGEALSAAEIREAIVAAAERRVANRRAAAS